MASASSPVHLEPTFTAVVAVQQALREAEACDFLTPGTKTQPRSRDYQHLMQLSAFADLVLPVKNTK